MHAQDRAGRLGGAPFGIGNAREPVRPEDGEIMKARRHALPL